MLIRLSFLTREFQTDHMVLLRKESVDHVSMGSTASSLDLRNAPLW